MEAQLSRFGPGRPARTYPNPACLACGTAFKPGQRTRPGPEGPGTLCERCWGRSRRGRTGSKPALLFSLRDAEHRPAADSRSFIPSLPLDSRARDASPPPQRPPPSRPRKRTGAGAKQPPAVAVTEPVAPAAAVRLTHAEMEDLLFDQAEEISRLKCEMDRLLDDVFELKRRLDESAAEADATDN